MKVVIANLTEENLADLPEYDAPPFSCKYCLYWEFPKEELISTDKNKVVYYQKKKKWLHETSESFGNCGKILYANGKAIGYAQYAPSEHLPCAISYQSGPPSADAVLISCLFICGKESRGFGLGSSLLQSIVDELIIRGVKSVETYARKGRDDNPSGPIEFYLKNGFKVLRDDPDFPLMRL